MQAHGIAVRETVDAKKQRYGERDIAAVFRGAREILVAKGSKTVSLAPGAEDLTAAVLGPSGNLRAPAVRLGKRWLVGFHEGAWTEALG